VWGPLFRRSRVRLRRERVTLPDGDFVDLDWSAGPPGAPLVLLVHGLEGSTWSHYMSGLLAEASARGWRTVGLNLRSCSGELNRLPRFYHSGDTGDLGCIVDHLLGREPRTPLGIVGVSIGGNMLLKWLGERGPDAPGGVRGAVALSVPFDLVACARTMDRGICRLLYTTNFLRTMRRKAVLKARRFPGFVDLEAVRRARTFAAYDRALTAPLHGFGDEMDYWVRASSRPYLPAIRRPTLLVNALDDPFVPAGVLPEVGSLPPGVTAEFPRHGGHVGFVEGRWPWAVRSWAERRAMEFLGPLIEGA